MRLRSLAPSLGFLLVVLPAHAADEIVRVPAPWRVSAPVTHAKGTTAAPLESSGAHAVLIARGDAVLVMPMPDRVWGTAVSPDGTHVLACSVVPTGYDGCAEESRCKVFETAVRIVDDRTWSLVPSFSADSARLVAWNDNAPAEMSRIAIHRLDGTEVAGIRPGSALRGVVGLGEGGVVLATKRAVVRLDPSGVSSTRWQHVPDGGPIWTLRLVSEGLVGVEQGFGRWAILDDDGAVRLDWDPVRMSEEDPARSWQDFAQYRAYGTSSASWVVVENGTARAFLLHVTTGRLSPFSMPVDASPGFLRQHGLAGGRLVFTGDDSILLRPLALPGADPASD